MPLFPLVLGLALLMRGAGALYNFYLQPQEVKKLLGLNAEVRYVNNGTVNDYALGFVVMIPDHMTDLYFTWQSLTNTPVLYSLSFTVSDPEVLNEPQLNISRKGTIPSREQVFLVALRCTGKLNAEVELYININITVHGDTTRLVLKRKKICLKDEGSHDTLMIDAMVAKNGSLYIGVGCACALVLAVAAAAVFAYFRTVKARRTEAVHYGGSSPALSTTTHGHTFMRPETPNNASSACSYSSFKRFTPVATTTTSVLVNEVKRDITEQISDVRVDRHKIILQEKLQEGTFGQIYHGIVTDEDIVACHGMHVFVKTVKEQASPIQVSLLTAEGMMMLGLHHESILPLVGLCTDDMLPPMLLYPYMSHGNLKKFLRRCMLAAEGHCRALTTQNLVGMALQIAQAVAFLHKKKIIHRDIATRNCVVDEALRVRLTDTTLSRDLFPMDYHCLGDNENRPIKWLALESLLRKEFSWASDVWAFGVTLWELLTLGQQPYIEIDPFEMHLYLRDGYRLNPPTNCPEELYTLMAFCWESLPDDRPSVAHLIGCLQDFYAALGRFI